MASGDSSYEARLMRLFTQDRPFPVIDLVVESHTPTGGQRTVLKNFSLLGREAGCEQPGLIQGYLDNLCRLGLILIPPLRSSTRTAAFTGPSNTTRTSRSSSATSGAMRTRSPSSCAKPSISPCWAAASWRRASSSTRSFAGG